MINQVVPPDRFDKEVVKFLTKINNNFLPYPDSYRLMVLTQLANQVPERNIQELGAALFSNKPEFLDPETGKMNDKGIEALNKVSIDLNNNGVFGGIGKREKIN